MDRLDEAKRLHAETTSGEWNDRADIDTDCEGFKRLYRGYGFGCTLIADGLRSCDRASIIALHALAPDLFALAEAAEWVVKAFEPIDDDTMSFLHDLKSAVDRVRGR